VTGELNAFVAQIHKHENVYRRIRKAIGETDGVNPSSDTNGGCV